MAIWIYGGIIFYSFEMVDFRIYFILTSSKQMFKYQIMNKITNFLFQFQIQWVLCTRDKANLPRG